MTTNQERLSSLPEKLKQARLATGMSTRSVAERLQGRHQVSHTTLSNYEAGRSQPTMTTLAALADVYQRPMTWFMRNGPMFSGIRYRNLKSRVRVSERHQFEAKAHKWCDAYRAIETWLHEPLGGKVPDLGLDDDVSGAEAARRFRDHLELDESDPIQSVIELLHRAGVRTLELTTDLKIDGMAAMLGEEHIVVLNPTVTNDRSRLNAAHELGHVLFDDCRRHPDREHEPSDKRAFEFASHLLLPDVMLEKALEGRSMVRLKRFKEMFGISLAAMIYRASAQRLIPERLAKQLWIEFAKRGWKGPNEPGHVRADPATRFEELLDRAIQGGELDWQQAADLTGVREDELRRRRELALGAVVDEPRPTSASSERREGPDLRLVQ